MNDAESGVTIKHIYQKVCVVLYNHKYGTDVFVTRDTATAWRIAADIAEEYAPYFEVRIGPESGAYATYKEAACYWHAATGGVESINVENGLTVLNGLPDEH